MISVTRAAPGSRWAAIPRPSPMTSSDTKATPSRTALLITPRTLSTRTASAAIATTMTVSTTRSTTTVPRTVVRLDVLALAQRVAPVQLAEPRRQDVVGEIADVRVAEDAPVRQRRDRREEGAPASTARADVDRRRHEHHGDPGRRRRPQDIERGGEVDRLDQDPDRDDADRDADRARAAARCD